MDLFLFSLLFRNLTPFYESHTCTVSTGVFPTERHLLLSLCIFYSFPLLSLPLTDGPCFYLPSLLYLSPVCLFFLSLSLCFLFPLTHQTNHNLPGHYLVPLKDLSGFHQEMTDQCSGKHFSISATSPSI